MLLMLYAVLTTLAFGSFILGHLLGFHGVASIGAVMVMIVGADVVLNDVQMKTGEQIDREYTTVNNTTVENSTTVNATFRTHSWTEQSLGTNALGLGIFQMLLGVLLFYQQMLAIGEGQ